MQTFRTHAFITSAKLWWQTQIPWRLLRFCSRNYIQTKNWVCNMKFVSLPEAKQKFVLHSRAQWRAWICAFTHTHTHTHTLLTCILMCFWLVELLYRVQHRAKHLLFTVTAAEVHLTRWHLTFLVFFVGVPLFWTGVLFCICKLSFNYCFVSSERSARIANTNTHTHAHTPSFNSIWKRINCTRRTPSTSAAWAAPLRGIIIKWAINLSN